MKLLPERLFLWLGLAFGVTFLVLTPPFQVPDEPNHFYRAWHVSLGNLTAEKKNSRAGGDLPVSLAELSGKYGNLTWSPESGDTKRLFRESLAIRLESDEVRFYDFNNTAAYPFVLYIPQAAGIFLTRIFELPPLVSFYAARLMALFTSLMLIYCAIRTLPVFRWLFAFIALLPISVYVNMSVSADVVTTGVCLLFAAYVFRLSRFQGLAGRSELLKLLALLALLCSVKMPYAPLAMLIVIIPTQVFGSLSRKMAITGAAAAFGLLVLYGWYTLADQIYIPTGAYDPDHGPEACLPGGVDVKLQWAYLFSEWSVFSRVFADSFVSCFRNHFADFTGAFDWGQVKLPAFMNALGYGLMLAIAITDSDQRALDPLARITGALTGLLIFSLIIISMYLSWHIVGYPYVVAFQGRYLLPFYFLFLIVFHNRLKTGRLPALLTVTGSALLLAYSAWLLINTYHIR